MTVRQHGWLSDQNQSKFWTNSLLICSAACERGPRYWRNHNAECNSYGVFKFFTKYIYWYIFLYYRFNEKKKRLNNHMKLCGNILFFLHFMNKCHLCKCSERGTFNHSIHHKVQPRSHTQDVLFQLNKCYLVNCNRSKCNQICKP